MSSLLVREMPAVQTVRLAIIQHSELNWEALANLFARRHDIATLWSGTSLETGVAACRQSPVDVLLMDASDQGRSALPMALELIASGATRGALLLDDLAHYERAAAASAHGSIGYFTRYAGFDALCNGVLRLAAGRPANDPVLSHGNGSAESGQLLRRNALISRISGLTPREREVMRLIALGKTVKDCASILHLAQSTVDNHKTRLMKKLDVHKSSDLTRLAIREGLISA